MLAADVVVGLDEDWLEGGGSSMIAPALPGYLTWKKDSGSEGDTCPGGAGRGIV